MFKKLLLLVMATSLSCSLQADVKREAQLTVEKLAEETKLRKRLELWNIYGNPILLLAGCLSVYFSQDKLTTFLNSVAAIIVSKCALYGAYYLQKIKAQYFFRKVYNKKYNHYGEVVPAFDFCDLPLLLNDEEFVRFGRGAGFTLFELHRLAIKSGRVRLAQELKNLMQ